MKNIFTNNSAISFILFLVFNPLSASAGTLVTLKVDSKNKNITFSRTFSLQSGKLRFDQQTPNSQQMIYDLKSDVLLMINHKEKSYSLLDRATLNNLNTQMQGIKQQMDAQLANIPPDQRAMVMKMMKGKLAASNSKPQPTMRVVKTALHDKVSGYGCHISEMRTTSEKVREMCVAAWSIFPQDDQFTATFSGMMSFFNDFMKSLSENMPVDINLPFAELEALNGFPIRSIEFNKGQISEVATLKSIEDKTFSADYFLPPKSYKRKDMIQQ